MFMKLGVVLFLLVLAKGTLTEDILSRLLIRAVPGPDCYISKQPQCSVKREAVGCFKSNAGQRELLLTARDSKSPVYFREKINWLEWANFIDKFTCACAMKACAKNYRYYTVENYGECWSGKNAQNGVSSGRCQVVKANECKFETCSQQHNDSRTCVGGSGVAFVYSCPPGPSTMPPTQPPTKGPSTMPPTQPPTKVPSTLPPTQPPTNGPSTEPPTQPPTNGPSTMPPTQPPTQPPTNGPSTMPSTQPPTNETPTVPTQPPTTAPVPQPTQPPTTSTSVQPTTEDDNCEE